MGSWALRLVFLSLVGACAARKPPTVVDSHDRAHAAGPGDSIVHVDSGYLRGRTSTHGVAFRAIPYATPPVGSLRWHAPEPVAPWSGIREATGFGYVCMQSPSSRDPQGTPMGSEDCLTLNVFSPDVHPAEPLPVLVFIHGGFFAWGSSSHRIDGVDVFDGSSLASRMPAVVVTLNYRLGPLGFLFGNFGLEDQIAALQWVKRNIALFGGDPARVTLSGHSAGAISTVALAAAPRARGLFARAIVFSGSGYAKPRALAAGLEQALVRSADCDHAKDVMVCMRTRSATEVVAALPEAFAEGNGYAPFVDGELLAASPSELFRAKRATPVPMIIGTTSNEFSTMLHTVIDKPILTDADLEEAIANRRGTPEGTRAVLAQYPVSSYPSRQDVVTAIWSDATMVCPTRWLARAIAALEPGKVWRFVYAHAYANPILHRLGAGHGLELALVFRNLQADFRLTPEETALGDAFTDALGRFVRDGNPASETLPWAPYDAASDSYLEVETPLTEKHGLRAAECDFWEPTASAAGSRKG